MKPFLLRFLNIRKDEAWLVQTMLAHQFFQDVGISFFFSAANALFLQNHPISELPKVYLLVAIFLWVVGYVYRKVEHRVKIGRLAPFVILFIAGSCISMGIAQRLGLSGAFYYVIFAWCNVIYLLNNLEFWGIASLLFDVRQSKRLFGIISSGDIPAKLIGYLSVPFLVQYLATGDLLILGGSSVLLGLVFLYPLRKKGYLDADTRHRRKPRNTPAETAVGLPLKRIWKDMFGNKLISSLALFSLLGLSASVLVGFSFFSEVKKTIKGDAALATFISLFMASGRILAFVFKVILSSRFTAALGIKGTLLITPIVMMLFLATILLSVVLPVNHDVTVLYLFGSMGVLTNILKTSFQKPVLISLMQPLKAQERLRGHNLMKGIMDPLAFLLSGTFLLILHYITGSINLILMCSILTGLTIAWLAMIFIVEKQYLKTLSTALHSRYSIGMETDFSDKQTMSVMLTRFEQADAQDAMYILYLMERQHAPGLDALALRALSHPAQTVRIEGLGLVSRLRVMESVEKIRDILNTPEDKELWAPAIKSLCNLQPDDVDRLAHYLDETSKEVVSAAVTGLIKSGVIDAVVLAGQKLMNMIHSESADERKLAAEIIGELSVRNFYKPLLELLHDKDPKVKKEAIKAAGKVANEKLMPELIAILEKPVWSRSVEKALLEAGETALPYIRDYVFSDKCDRKTRLRFILLCGRTSAKEADALLIDLLAAYPIHTTEILHALHTHGYTADTKFRAMLHDLAEKQIKAAVNTVGYIHTLESKDQLPLLRKALVLETDEIKERLLWIFALLYKSDKILRARNGILSRRKELVANAIEIIELTVAKEYARPFAALAEQTGSEEKFNQLRSYITEGPIKASDILSKILYSKEYQYNGWSQSCAIYEIRKNPEMADYKAMETLTTSPDRMVRETARAILNLRARGNR